MEDQINQTFFRAKCLEGRDNKRGKESNFLASGFLL